MNPNTSIRRIFLREDNRISLNDGVENNGEWDTPEYHDTTDNGQKKEAKAFTFYRMETKEISERYVAPCFVNGLEAYDGEINLEHDITNLQLYYVWNMKSSAWKIIPKVKKGIANFGNEIITIYPDLDPFNDDSDKTDNSGDDLDAILEGIDFRDISEIKGIDVSPFVCNMGKSSRNKKKPYKNYKMKYDD
ncbi:hypothetical protein Tco_1520851, partial [Tanacetum coccineum]